MINITIESERRCELGELECGDFFLQAGYCSLFIKLNQIVEDGKCMHRALNIRNKEFYTLSDSMIVVPMDVDIKVSARRR